MQKLSKRSYDEYSISDWPVRPNKIDLPWGCLRLSQGAHSKKVGHLLMIIEKMIYFGKSKNSVGLKPNAEWKKDAKAPSIPLSKLSINWLFVSIWIKSVCNQFSTYVT